MFSSATRSVIQRLLILTVLISCLALFSTGVSRRSFGTSLGQSPERVTEQIAARPQTAQVSTNNTRPRIQIGAKLPLEGVDWATNQKTLVVALSDKCHFCTDSANFYQRLSQDHGSAALIAVLPQPVDESKQYLSQLKVMISDVRQVPLTSLAVTATPTLILVDKDGTVLKSWVGKLKPEREAEVIARLR